MSKKVKLIIGSTREGRVATQIAEWVKAGADSASEINLEVIDLKELDLPFFKEAIPPAYGKSDKEHIVAWSNIVTDADAFIFLTAEYNRGYPASLKNAIDYLADEWKDKTALIVSYGYIDGGKSAEAQLRQVLSWLKLRTVATSVNIKLSQDIFDENGSIKDIASTFSQHSEKLKTGLNEISKTELSTIATS